MKRHHTAIATLACSAALMLSACGGGGGAGSSQASFCNDYKQLSGVAGTDQATLQKAANLYGKLANEAPGEIRGDLNTLADAETKVMNGQAALVDSNAADAAANHADNYVSSKC
jgi:hypothetical protein